MVFSLFLDQFWGGETEENLIDMVAGMSIALNLAKIAPESFENQSLDVQIGHGTRFAWEDQASKICFWLSFRLLGSISVFK